MAIAPEELKRRPGEEIERRKRLKALLAELALALPSALAVAFYDADELVPVARAARQLRLTPERLILGCGANRIPLLPIQRRGRRAFVRRGDLDRFPGATAHETPGATVRLLAEALAAALPKARAHPPELLD